MNKHATKIIYALIAATFFVPLVVMPTTFIFPFIVPKVLLFRTLVVCLLAAVVLFIANGSIRWRMKWNIVDIFVVLFFLSFLVSSFFGVDSYRSFWDNHERMLGLFTFFHYTAYYFLLRYLIRSEKEFRGLAKIFLFAGFLVMLIAFAQKFFEPNLFLNNGGGRVIGSLGNSIYLSGYGLFLGFLGAMLAVYEKRGSFWWWYAVVGAAFGFFGIFFGGTRGTLVGLLAGLGVLFFWYFFLFRKNRKAIHSFLSILIIGIVAAGGLFFFRDTPFVRSIPAVGGLLNVSLEGGTARTRIIAWDIAIQAWQDRPIIGWGPNNYYYAFNAYYNPESLTFGLTETWFDNAHNIFFNTLATQGTIGILLYVGLFVIVIYSLWRAWRRGTIDPHTAGIASAFFVAHFVHNLFVFENPTSYLYFFFFLAYAAIISFPAASSIKTQEKKNIRSYSVLGAVGVFVFFIFWYATDVNPARANMATFTAIKGFIEGSTDLSAYNKVTAIPTPHIDDVRNDLGQHAGRLIPKLTEVGKIDEARAMQALAYDELEKNFSLHPLDVRTHLQRAQLAQFGYQLTKNGKYLFEAEAMLEDARKKSPRRQQVEYMLAIVKMQVNKPEEAIAILRSSIDNAPAVSEGWVRLGAIYKDTGKDEEARALIAEAREKGVLFSELDEEVIRVIVATNTLS